jgi:hypothetical protein
MCFSGCGTLARLAVGVILAAGLLNRMFAGGLVTAQPPLGILFGEGGAWRELVGLATFGSPGPVLGLIARRYGRRAAVMFV